MPFIHGDKVNSAEEEQRLKSEDLKLPLEDPSNIFVVLAVIPVMAAGTRRPKYCPHGKYAELIGGVFPTYEQAQQCVNQMTPFYRGTVAKLVITKRNQWNVWPAVEESDVLPRTSILSKKKVVKGGRKGPGNAMKGDGEQHQLPKDFPRIQRSHEHDKEFSKVVDLASKQHNRRIDDLKRRAEKETRDAQIKLYELPDDIDHRKAGAQQVMEAAKLVYSGSSVGSSDVATPVASDSKYE